MRHRALAAFALTVLSLSATTRPAAAAWPHDPNSGNVALCKATGNQLSPFSVPDGAGGAVVAWYDNRSGNQDIYVQRVSAAGTPLWTADGVPLCVAAGDQYQPRIAPDGAGGAIVTWYDNRSGNLDIYAQRISGAGVVQWTANGVALCTAAGNQSDPTIVSDGAGGGIVSWYDFRSGNADIYARRISAGGAVQWGANGTALCTAANNQYSPTIASDGAGGAIVTWYDDRSGSSSDIYAQRIGAAGAVQWIANGVLVCGNAGDQFSPVIAADGAGGAVVAWDDRRSGTSFDIYAQRLTAAGAEEWSFGGVALCTTAQEQELPQIVSDGSGGAIVTWLDYRGGVTSDIYAQRVAAAGATQWTENGVGLCTAAGQQVGPVIVSDGTGGAIVAWYDNRGGLAADIYAQRIGAVGATQWNANGVALCTAEGSNTTPTISSDGAGGAIVTWMDNRSFVDSDIYAQRVDRFGMLGNPEPVLTGIKDVKNDQGGSVKVSWNASYLDAEPTLGIWDYRVWRSAPAALVARQGLARGFSSDPDVAARDGAYLVLPVSARDYAWELVATQPVGPLPSYSVVTSTTGDSIGGSNPGTAFMVQARAGEFLGAPYWFSAPDSGYSVDNLPPVTPAPFTGTYASGTTSMLWNANLEADLSGYRLYRGSSPAFVPGPGNLLTSPTQPHYVDAAGAPYVYKLTAVDTHGNESPVATLIPGGVLAVEGSAPLALAFAPPSPNPARGTVALRWTLSNAGPVRLSVFDPAGRRVASLHDGVMSAGEHAQTFELRDAAGHGLASGLYIVRLEAEGRVLTRRLAAVR